MDCLSTDSSSTRDSLVSRVPEAAHWVLDVVLGGFHCLSEFGKAYKLNAKNVVRTTACILLSMDVFQSLNKFGPGRQIPILKF